ncbi:putative TetR-family transcriptional regulator [Actinoplanes capillaceus]|uniref:TetR-family transcriptional regulator n=1 Tax=Actinoplanes campanulatus TaxID=113559 RepID=A0ABQ3WKW4_9ACTN|nr:TetR/AcrR family transcriptional regulator [Actinoplanes capillaceus]GID46878.1 putative TetR-family transcriptional regulator [Actinoplanes capillaceus]
MEPSAYHHGNLRRVMLDAALQAIGESGPTGWSLRELARRAGVSHTAPAHHFGDKTGLLTAVAAEGFDLFAAALEAAGGDFLEVGVAYVRFAVLHRSHFQVMFRPELYRPADPAVAPARARAAAVLSTGGRALSPDPARDRLTTVAAWSMAHGFADLWLSGALADAAEIDPEAYARDLITVAFGHLHHSKA